MTVTPAADACGVPGGNGTSCLDACGVANGDGGSCADACGVPHGDGASCAAAAAAADDGAGFACANASDGLARAERQTVRLAMDAGSLLGMFGSYRLTFNGATTAPVSVFADGPTIAAALAALETVGVDGGGGAGAGAGAG